MLVLPRASDSQNFRTVYGETAMARKDSSVVDRSDASIRARRKQRWVVVACGVAGLALAIGVRAWTGTPQADAQIFGSRSASADAKSKGTSPAATKKNSAAMPRPERPKHDVMAVVNGEDIRREALAAACVDRFGDEVLEGLVNKRLIEHHCRNRNLTVTDAETDAEIERMAARFKIGRKQWLAMLEKERGINEQQYRRDILWPTLALRKLAADQLQVSDEQVQKAYESQFGEAVKARLIVVESREEAEKLHRQLSANPNDFARLAMQESIDVNSASIGGLIQPIRRHVGDPGIEQAVFALRPDELTQIIPVADQFAILKCEGRLPAREVPLASVRDELVERIKENTLRDVASNLFEQLQSSATIQNVWNDPQLRAQMPGIVATINGQPIQYQELAEECLLRHGEQVLQVEVSHLLLQQALAKENVSVTQQDLDDEIAHAARLAGVVDAQGNPDFDKWFKLATEEQGLKKEQYLRDSVWPSTALKKLTGDSVQVSPNDLKKSYDANYGQRVRCRAIVLGDMRRAQEVWAKARENPTVDFFGDLAEQYSIEPQSKALRGEVPPIRRNGGQPQLEEVAFEMAQDELSGIVQLGDKFVILRCEGRTEPVQVRADEVNEILNQDIYEKKLRIAMNDKFTEIHDRARIDNYLAGTSQSPDRVKPGAEAVKLGPDGRKRTLGDTYRMDSAVRPTGGQER
jgi:parvulin-like peptidyl-prolyl isomerase